MEHTKIALLGLGLMGSGMAGRLLDAGYPLTIWNRTPDKTQAFANHRQKLAPVRGGSTGLRRDEARPNDAARAHLVAADPERVERARDRRVGQPARLGEPLAQTNDARKRVDDAKALRCRPGDEQPAIVCAQVQRGI